MSGKKLLIAATILLIAGLLGYWYFFRADDTEYADITDLSNEYNIDSELVAAQKKLAENIEPAQIYVNSFDKSAIALTFDGLPDPTTTDRILDLLDKYQVKATFFVDGSSAAKDNDSLKKIYKHKYPVGNYTYVALAQLEKMPAEEIFTQLLKTQKVVKVTTGTAPDIFKAPQTNYTPELLKTAAAAGLKAAVKTNIYVKKDDIKTDKDAADFIKTIKPGDIISLPAATPVNHIVYEPGKTDERPAFDKQPSLQININDDIKHQDIVDVTERLLKAIKENNIETMYVTDCRLVNEAGSSENEGNNDTSSIRNKQTNSFKQQKSFIAKVLAFADELLFTKAFAANNYEPLRKENAGKKALLTKMILTSEPAVGFAFAGLTKPVVVYDVLDRLKKMEATGTFFIMKNDIDQHPQLVRDIINSGNEVQIGIRSLKGSDFYSVCNEINYVRSKLEAMGASAPTLAMQPWGAVPDDTAEAVSAMGLKFIGHYIDAVKSNMKDYTSEEQVVNELLGKYIYSLGRGWIVYFRLDYYTDDTLVGREMDLLKRDKIDNIAYNSFYDDPKINHNNDSSYKIKSVGAILNNTAHRYKFVTKDKVPEELRDDQNPLENEGITFNDYIRKRYIGNYAVGKDSNAKGFSIAEEHLMDMTGCVNTNKPVIFFTFDDWGTDASINRLLYVFRKHKAKATFFVLTHNVLSNPNLLRAIAVEGHDIGAHSDMHKPMTTQNSKTGAQLSSVQSKDEYMKDLSDCYKKLETVTGDVMIGGRPALTRTFRPPQLNISKMGFECLYANGYSYVVNGFHSTHDYEQHNLNSMINDIKTGIFDETGKVRKGAVLVMHMSDTGEYTAVALDMILTANAQRKDGDPAKFVAARLSDYLRDDYDQSKPDFDKESGSGADYNRYLYKNSGYKMGGE